MVRPGEPVTGSEKPEGATPARAGVAPFARGAFASGRECL
jgi:hypothetical protein